GGGRGGRGGRGRPGRDDGPARALHVRQIAARGDRVRQRRGRRGRLDGRTDGESSRGQGGDDGRVRREGEAGPGARGGPRDQLQVRECGREGEGVYRRGGGPPPGRKTPPAPVPPRPRPGDCPRAQAGLGQA